MITKNPMQLKAFIKNKAAEKHISAQLVMQNYMLERLLERISLSPYKHNFILKGGFLISAIVGLDTRATMDLDTTIKGFTLTHEAILSIFKVICDIQISDDVQFEVIGVSDIRETDDYPGLKLFCPAALPTPVQETIMIYIFCMCCAVQNVIPQRCVKRWSGQLKNAVAK